ncbi:dirigent protein 4 [Curcuma longa]|uniref:dirigent protein 4 n=1 Tax=Curcuma longa TaxID=136217 RepID=UPI003D9E6364
MARRGRGAAPFLVLLAFMAAQCFHQSTEATVVTTNLHFFFHDTISGSDPSAVLVASAPGRSDEGLGVFGDVFAVDDPLTEGPEADSPVVGYARGFYMLASRRSLILVMGLDYGFTAGPFNGSSFSVFSQNPALEQGDRELAVVGGRGKFRMARGFALLRTYSANFTTGDAVVEYNVTLFHDD